MLVLALELASIAVGVGVVSSMIGVGGGFLVVPILVLLFGVEPHMAVGTSLAMIVLTALSSTFAYWRQRRIDYGLGLVLTASAIPGAAAGAYATTFISPGGLKTIFGLFLVVLAARMFLKPGSGDGVHKAGDGGWERSVVDSRGVTFEYKADVAPGVALSFFAGFASGFLGIGGGALMVPVMNYAVGMPIHLTVATSLFMMIFTSLTGAFTHLLLGNVMLDYAVFLGLGITLGAQVGAAAARRMKPRSLQRAFSIALIATGLRMALTPIIG